ncbi:MAG: AAA family ATPase, partial [Lachnospiraceae bacterium]|nr:AAA family ATPase [Lachnospiraceae bacterium]
MVEKLKSMIGEFFVGKEDAVINLLTCLAAGGHVLIEDAPGMGKTTLARTLAGACGCSFSRIQFTP